jgi:hypothetical protein
MSHFVSIDRQRKSNVPACLGLSVSLALIGCSSAGPDPKSQTEPDNGAAATTNAPEARSLVAELDLEEGHRIQIWEVKSGIMELTETSKIGTAPKVTASIVARHTSFVGLYEELSGGRAAPAPLFAAESRRAAFEAKLARPTGPAARPVPELGALADRSQPPATARAASPDDDQYNAEGEWFAATFCPAAPKTWSDCRMNLAFAPSNQFKLILESIGSSWFEASVLCHQYTGKCGPCMGYDHSGVGDYTYTCYDVEPRTVLQVYSTGIATRGARFNGWGSTDEPGISTRMSTAVRWTPYPTPAGDCNWEGDPCCDPYSTGTGMCDATYDSFLYCDQASQLCAVPASASAAGSTN